MQEMKTLKHKNGSRQLKGNEVNYLIEIHSYKSAVDFVDTIDEGKELKLTCWLNLA